MDSFPKRILTANNAIATSVCAGGLVTTLIFLIALFVASPFVPDSQEKRIWEGVRWSATVTGVSLPWSIASAMLWFQSYVKEDERLEHLERLERASKPKDTRCSTCKYFSSDAIGYLAHPCAIHPKGRPGERPDDCSDWE